MENLTPKPPTQSAVETRYLLMPDQANQYGTAFGGIIVAWIDMVAAMAAERHCNKQVVTAGIDSLSFKHPIRIGEHAVLKASVNYAGRTSMEVGVRVLCENPITGTQSIATTAHLTFVAVDDDQKPVVVPPIEPVTDDEKRRYRNAEVRTRARKELRQKME